MQALFTSRDGGTGLQARISAALAEAGAAARNGPADLQIMRFAFTDPRIAPEIVALARAHPGLLIRSLADWSQGAPRDAAMLEALRREGLATQFLKVKLDMPDRWDAVAGRMGYSYGASREMLHHKTLCLSVDGRPRLLVLHATGDLAPVLAAFAAEFEAIWSDHRLTAALGRAQAVAARRRAEAAVGRDLTDAGLLADVYRRRANRA